MPFVPVVSLGSQPFGFLNPNPKCNPNSKRNSEISILLRLMARRKMWRKQCWGSAVLPFSCLLSCSVLGALGFVVFSSLNLSGAVKTAFCREAQHEGCAKKKDLEGAIFGVLSSSELDQILLKWFSLKSSNQGTKWNEEIEDIDVIKCHLKPKIHIKCCQRGKKKKEEV